MAHSIVSLAHPLVKHLVKIREDKTYRNQCGTALIQGRKVIAEVGQRISIQRLIVTDEALIPPGLKAQELVITSEAVIRKVAGVMSAEGIVAELPLPPQASLDQTLRIIALDGVADPGNLGTLLRTALALGWDGAYLINCCDPFNDKALRAAMGATFRLPLRSGTAAELHQMALQKGWHCLAADLHGQRPTSIPMKPPILLVLGSEAHGVSEECRQFTQLITIPMSGEMESLNVSVAGGILMYLVATEGTGKISPQQTT